MPTRNFWNTAAASGRSFPVLSPETSQSSDMTSLGAATGVPRSGRTLSWNGGRQVPPGLAVNSPAHLAALEILLATSPAGLRPLPDQRPFRTRRHPRHATEKPRRRILEVRIQPLVTAMNRIMFFSRILVLLRQSTSELPERASFHTRRQSIFLASASAMRRFSAGRLALAPLLTSSLISAVCRR